MDTSGPGYFGTKTVRVIVIIIVIEMNIIKVALSHFCCRTTVQSDNYDLPTRTRLAATRGAK